MRDPPPSSSSTPTLSPTSSVVVGSYSRRISRDKFSEREIFAAVRGKSCPICLEKLTDQRVAVIAACKHGYCVACIRRWSGFKRNCPLCNGRFDSWFIVSDRGSRKYQKERLPVLTDCNTLTSRRWDSPSERPRIIRRSRGVLENSSSRSRPLPWRRSFGPPGSVPELIIFQEKLRWRASIYDRRLQAVPLYSRQSLEQNSQVNDHTKARIVERIEPWIRRELQAVLGDPDPSIIFHFVSALFIKSLERKNNRQSGQTEMLVEEEVSSLRKFLHDKAEIFWHELRCFAESNITMETYDAVVEYNVAG